MRPRWDASVYYEPPVLHSYNPHSLPRKSALKRRAQFSYSPHFDESPLDMYHRNHASIHPLLASSDTPALVWDVSTSPKRIVPRDLSYEHRYRALSESATDTPCRSLEVVHKDGLWEGSFPVRSRYAPYHFSQPSEFVTVGDVVYSLYDSFRKPVIRSEYDRLCASFPHLKDGVLNAYWDRCMFGRSEEEADKEINRGIRVVDLFMGSLTWVGLTFGRNSRELRLHVRPGRP